MSRQVDQIDGDKYVAPGSSHAIDHEFGLHAGCVEMGGRRDGVREQADWKGILVIMVIEVRILDSKDYLGDGFGG